FGNIAFDKNGGYIFGSISLSDKSGNKTEDNLAPYQGWSVKFDSAGKKIWDKTIHTWGPGQDGACLAVSTSDSCYAFAIYTSNSYGPGSDKSQPIQGAYDYWIIKFCDSTLSFISPPVSKFTSSDTSLCAYDCITFSNL